MKHAAPKPTVEQSKRHIVFDRKILVFPLTVVVFSVFANVVGLATAPLSQDLRTSAAAILGSALLLLAYQLYFRKELDSIVIWSTAGMVIAAPGLLFALSNVPDIVKHFGALNPFLPTLIMGAAPGVSEEIMFRGIPVSNWMRMSCSKRSILPSVLISSLFFGFIHGLNGIMGADPASTVFQVFYATCIGILTAAVFLRCGSLWPVMILHTFIDFTAFLSMDMSKGGLMTEVLEFDLSFYITLVASILLVVYGLYLVRPSKHDEIVAFWEKKTYRA